MGIHVAGSTISGAGLSTPVTREQIQAMEEALDQGFTSQARIEISEWQNAPNCQEIRILEPGERVFLNRDSKLVPSMFHGVFES